VVRFSFVQKASGTESQNFKMSSCHKIGIGGVLKVGSENKATF
jgi:hypothetical protein